ncbi:MAG: hypothetical protein H0T54_04760 [Geodermatophilaceae bacterium]|nr:hypothetical protein [Geodermatophilaceae bacterium]
MSTSQASVAGRHFWERTAWGWHTVFVAMITLAGIAAATDSSITGAGSGGPWACARSG